MDFTLYKHVKLSVYSIIPVILTVSAMHYFSGRYRYDNRVFYLGQ